MTSELSIRVEKARPHQPSVRLLVDGSDILDPLGHDDGNDPDDLFLSGALLPTDPPRRIAFYGCSCGTFGCHNTAGLISRQGGQIVWSDFRSLLGQYETGPLPDPDEGPDPWASANSEDREEFYPGGPLDVAPVVFDAQQYLADVERAAADRSWESHARAVVRHLRERRPQWSVTDVSGDAISINDHSRPGAQGRLRVPRGDPEVQSNVLIALMDSGVLPGVIARKRLWR